MSCTVVIPLRRQAIAPSNARTRTARVVSGRLGGRISSAIVVGAVLNPAPHPQWRGRMLIRHSGPLTISPDGFAAPGGVGNPPLPSFPPKPPNDVFGARQ